MCISFCCNPHGRNYGEVPDSGSPVSNDTTEQLRWRREIVQIRQKPRLELPNSEWIPAVQGSLLTAPTIEEKCPQKIISIDIGDQHLTDMAHMQRFSKLTNGYKCISMSVNCFSRYACAVDVVSKKPPEILTGFEKFLEGQVSFWVCKVITVAKSR